MAYTFEQSYYFRPYRGNSSFWLNRYGNGSIASHQKATLYTAAGSEQSRKISENFRIVRGFLAQSVVG